MSYNVHFLTHVSDCVRNWGSPWAYSAFIFENAGGSLKQQFHGSKHITKQMFQNFFARGKMRMFSRYYIPNSTDAVINLYNRLDSPLPAYDSNVVVTRLFGEEEIVNISDRILGAIELAINSQLNRPCYIFSSFQRMKLNGRTYSTAKYCEGFKRNNSVVQLVTDDIYTIVNIIKVNRECVCQGKHLSCQTPFRSLFSNEEIFFIGNKVNVFSPSVSGSIVRETYFDGRDIIGFMKKIDSRSNFHIISAFPPYNVKHKAIVIEDEKKNKFCIINKLRFELD